MTDTADAPTEMDVVVFPHAGRFKIDFVDFVEHWRKWSNPSRPDNALDLDDVLVVLARQAKFDALVDGNYDRGFDALCRSIVPKASRDTLQASSVFFEKNRDFFEVTRAVNPHSGRTVKATRLRPWAMGTLAVERDEPTEPEAYLVPIPDVTTSEERFASFADLSNAKQSWAGADARNFVSGIIDPDHHPELHSAIDRQLPAGLLLREDVARLVANPIVDTLFVALAVMAWGRMRPTHVTTFFEQRANWLGLVEDLRRKSTNRADAYRRFAALRKARCLDGVGPAYFTKLIFFLTSAHEASERPGYIMDQWTARSANFLAGEAFIALDVAGPKGERRVADRNTPETYERFCTFVEDLAVRMGITPAEVEMRMFAGGNRQNEWRGLVRRLA